MLKEIQVGIQFHPDSGKLAKIFPGIGCRLIGKERNLLIFWEEKQYYKEDRYTRYIHNFDIEDYNINSKYINQLACFYLMNSLEFEGKFCYNCGEWYSYLWPRCVVSRCWNCI